MVLVMEKTKKVPVCGGGGKINKQQWMITSPHQGFFILASSVSGQHVRHPSLFYPSLNCVPWQHWFIQLALCGARWESLSNSSHEGRQSTYGRLNGIFLQGKILVFLLLSTHPQLPKIFQVDIFSSVVFQCLPLQPFWSKIWDTFWS